MKKRAVSVLLALALCLGLTVFASAEDQSDETPADPFTDVAEDAISCVAYGTGASLDNLANMQDGTINLSRRRQLNA